MQLGDQNIRVPTFTAQRLFSTVFSLGQSFWFITKKSSASLSFRIKLESPQTLKKTNRIQLDGQSDQIITFQMNQMMIIFISSFCVKYFNKQQFVIDVNIQDVRKLSYEKSLKSFIDIQRFILKINDNASNILSQFFIRLNHIIYRKYSL